MRATVVLPLPLSPTSARARPGERASEVSSTACTADGAPNSLNWRKGKYLRKCTASRMACAAGGLVHCRGDGLSSPSPPDFLSSPSPPDFLSSPSSLYFRCSFRLPRFLQGLVPGFVFGRKISIAWRSFCIESGVIEMASDDLLRRFSRGREKHR